MNRLFHIIFLPVFGEVGGDFLLNFSAIIIFIVIYLWHIRRDHRNNEKLLNEIRNLIKEIRKNR